jgi:hypothetical protein
MIYGTLGVRDGDRGLGCIKEIYSCVCRVDV